MNLYEDQFSDAHDFPHVDKPSKVLVVASTARCGSHMLGHALHKTGSFGFPLEYSQPANLAEWKRRLGKTEFVDVLAEIQHRRTSPNGVFGIKVHYSHIAEYGGFRSLLACFPNAYFVLLRRQDALKQAVSLAIAKQTGVWISGQKPINSKPRYDFDQIHECLRRTVLENASWRYLLAAYRCKYMELSFDDVKRDLPQVIQRIAGFIDVSVDPERIPNKQVTSKQGDDLNGKWLERFTADFAGREEYLLREQADPLRRIKRVIKRAVGSYQRH